MTIKVTFAVWSLCVYRRGGLRPWWCAGGVMYGVVNGGAENARVENVGVETTGEDSRGGNCRSGRSRSRSHGWNIQERKIQELKHMESRPYKNFWRTKLESGCVWLPTVESHQLMASPTELTGLVHRVGVIHFDVEADSDSGAQKLRVFILLLYSVFCRRVCNAYDNYSRMLVYCMIWLLVWYVRTFICVCVCRTLMPFRTLDT